MRRIRSSSGTTLRYSSSSANSAHRLLRYTSSLNSPRTPSRTQLCGYDLNLTYPQNGHFPALTFVEPSNNEEPFRALSRFNSRTRHETRLRAREVLRKAKRSAKIEQRDSMATAAAKKRDLSGRANGTIDPWYGCDIYDEMIDYAVNFSAPWSECL